MAVDWDAPENLHVLDGRVTPIVLGGGHARDVLALARLMRREKPDAIVSALAYCNMKITFAAVLAGMRDRLILTYHGYRISESGGLSGIGYDLLPILSRLAAAVVAVSDSLRTDLIARFRAPAAKTTRIYNPVKVDGVPADLSAETLAARPRHVVALGRLVPGKDFPTLIRAFAHPALADARLTILGEGLQRAALEAEIRMLGLVDRVALPGHAIEPWPWFRQARCFASSSQMESFGLVLVEALAHGLPVVSTRCGATAEVLEDGRFGTLVPVGDVEAMALAIAAALDAPGDPAPRLAHARRFSTEAALDAYEHLIDRVAGRRAPARLVSDEATVRPQP